MKTKIIESIGQRDLLQLAALADGLAANDRVKARLSILQAAVCHAQAPDIPAPDMTMDCAAAGLEGARAAALIAGARLASNGRVQAPMLRALGQGIAADLEDMIRAVEFSDEREGKAARERLAAIDTAGSLEMSRGVDPEQVAQLTSLPYDGGDSLHRLVMDLHKAINRQAAQGGATGVVGTRTFGLVPQDRSHVEAFVRGVDSTRALKFDHPGLDTIAVRRGDRLSIQNDIGTTDAHVLVITLAPETLTVIYSDVHRARAKFLMRLLDGGWTWSGPEERQADGFEKNTFHLITGRYQRGSDDRTDELLMQAGAALVFLIDWNKARKALRRFVAEETAVRVLEWAARARLGHRAFVQLGGADLLRAAIERAVPGAASELTLDSLLGPRDAQAALEAMLRICTETLRAGAAGDVAEAKIAAELERLERHAAARHPFQGAQANGESLPG